MNLQEQYECPQGGAHRAFVAHQVAERAKHGQIKLSTRQQTEEQLARGGNACLEQPAERAEFVEANATVRDAKQQRVRN
jgi:hypothetical protein